MKRLKPTSTPTRRRPTSLRRKSTSKCQMRKPRNWSETVLLPAVKQEVAADPQSLGAQRRSRTASKRCWRRSKKGSKRPNRIPKVVLDRNLGGVWRCANRLAKRIRPPGLRQPIGPGCAASRPLCSATDGPDPLALRAAVPRRGSRLDRSEPSGAGAGGRSRGGDGLPPRVAAEDARRRLGRDLLAEGVRRPRRDDDRAGDLRRRGGAPGSPQPGQRARPGDGRAGGDRPRHRRAEAALPGADPHRRGDLVPGLLRARVGLRPRLAEDAGGQGRRRMGGQRPEGLDHLRPVRQVVHARRSHRPRRPQAQGAHLLPDGHGAAGGRGQAAGADNRRGRVQRGLHGRSADPRRQHRRRGRQRLGGGDHDADERARRSRLRRDRPDRQQPQRGSPALASRDPRQRRHGRRGPGLPAADRPAPHRGGDDAPQRLPRPDQDDAVGHSRPGGLAGQVAVGRHQPAHSRAGAGDRGRLRAARARRRSTRSTAAPGSTASCAHAPTRSRAAPPTSSRTSSPSACSACRGCARAAGLCTSTSPTSSRRSSQPPTTSSPRASNPSGCASWPTATTASSSPAGTRWPSWAGPGLARARGVGWTGARHRRARRPLRGDGLRAGALAALLQHDRRPGAGALRLRRSARALPAAAGRGRAARHAGPLGCRLARDARRLHDGGAGRWRRGRPRRREGARPRCRKR